MGVHRGAIALTAATSRIAALSSIVALVSGAGCGVGLTRELMPGPGPGPGDAGQETTSQSPVCSVDQPFNGPTLVPGLNDASASVIAARFSPDELTAYLTILHGPQEDIYLATRGSRSDPFGPATPISELNTTTEDEYPTVTADGLTLYLGSTRSGYYDLFFSTRPTPTATFSMPMELTALHVNGEGCPYVIPDGSVLYFHTYRAGNFDIYRTVKNAQGFDRPEALSMINTTADESMPVVSPDELAIYFFHQGDPNGPDGVWMATRPAKANPFQAPVPLAYLNTPYRAVPTWISPDGCRLYLQQQDPQQGFSVYVAERSP